MVEEGSTTLMAGEKVMIGELETTKFVTGVLSINMSRKYVISFHYYQSKYYLA